MKRRSKIDIVAQILQVVHSDEHDQISKNKIRYKAFIPHLQIQKHLLNLVENGLLNYDQKQRDYKVTEKGILFIQAYNKLKEYIDVESFEEKNFQSPPTAIIKNTN